MPLQGDLGKIMGKFTNSSLYIGYSTRPSIFGEEFVHTVSVSITVYSMDQWSDKPVDIPPVLLSLSICMKSNMLW